MQIATKTLAAIDAAIAADQGSKYRGLLGKLMPLADDAYREEDGGFRSHLGASLIGRECARELWYNFHWATKPRFEARILRLFNRGHLEEPRMVALLMMIGCEVWQVDENGKQFRIEGHGGHYSSAIDGVVRNLPDLPPGTACLTEYKTHNDKSFTKLTADGVVNAKWEHFVQMQQYMGKYGLQWALYMATNKNDDHIHAELLQFDSVVYARYHERAGSIIYAQDPPPKINNSPAFFKCKFCDQSKVCHSKQVPERNCRTCMYSRPEQDGKWYCNRPVFPDGGGAGELLSKDAQEAGCPEYSMRDAFCK